MILVTGGTGFLGAHLLAQLVRNNVQVKAVHRSTSSFEFVKRVFALNGLGDPQQLIRWELGDLTDIFSVESLLKNVSQVYHCAGEVNFNAGADQFLTLHNARATANLVNACLLVPGIRLCHVSSIAAIGRSRLDDTIAEDRFWKNDPNNSRYAIAKYNAEREVWRGIEEGLDAVIVNPGVIMGYCPWDEGTGKMFENVANGLRFYTDGISGFVGVEDVAKAMLYLMNASEIKGERYILVSENCSYKDIFSWIAKALHKPEPGVKANTILLGLAWRMAALKGKLTGKSPLITKETARTSTLKCYYDNQKSKRVLPFEYTPMKQVIEETAVLFKNETSL